MSDAPQAQETTPERKLQLLHEAYRLGMLPAEKRRLYEGAIKLKMIDPPPVQPSGVMAAGGALGGTSTPPEADTEIGIGLASPGPAPPVAQMPGQSARGTAGVAVQRSRDLPGEMRLLQGYDPSVDYDTGTGWNDAVAMYRSDNPREKRAYLAKKYGPDNVFTDRGGRFVVRGPEGKLMSPEGTGFVNDLMQGGAQIYADAPMLAGGVGGAILGAPAGPGGAVAGMVGGSALGKGLTEGVKAVTGEFDKTAGETAEAVGLAGLYGGAGEAAGRLVTQIPRVAGNAFRKYVSRPTKESRDLTASVERAGGVAPIRSAAPGLGPLAIGQDLAMRLGYNPLEGPNRRAVHGRLADIADLTPAQREAPIEEILNPTARVSATEAGESVLGAVQRHGAHLEADVENLTRDADRMLNRQLSQLGAVSRRAPAGMGGGLGMDFAAGLSQARAEFSRSMEKGYSQIDRLVAPMERPQPQAFSPNREMTDEALFGVPSANRGAPVPTPPTGIVPTPTMKKAAGRILDSLPKGEAGEPIFADARVLRALNQLRNAPEKMPLGETQRIRTILGEMGEFTDMMPGVAKRDFNDLRHAVNSSIQAAALDPAAGPAIRLLRKMDDTYREGIRKFGDAEINQMVAQAKTGIMPDPGVIADKVLAPGNLSRARTMREMVGPDVWKRVAAADMDNMLGRGGSAVDPQTGDISARKFAALIADKDKSGMLELTYGPSVARQMRLYGKRMDARGGKVPAEVLTPDNFGQTMRQLETAQQARDAFLSRNFLSELSDPKKMPDDAINFVASPGQQTKLAQTQAFFSDDSPQMEAIRKQAREELLHSAIVVTGSGATTSIAGDGIENALSRWTPRQQEILFPDGLAADMGRLAREIRFMYPRNPNAVAGGMAAGAIGLLPFPTNIPVELPFKVWAYFLSKPSVVRALSEGLKPGPRKAATRETIRMIFREAALGELPHPDEEPAPGVMSRRDATEAVMGRKQAPPPSGSQLRPSRDLRPSAAGP